MITRILIYIKHHFNILWFLIEKANAFLFRIFYNKRFHLIADKIITTYTLPGYQFRKLAKSELPKLEELLLKQSETRITYFNPHDFHLRGLQRILKNPAFLMMGVFDEEKLVGYFFLRCFWNKKCFVGRLIDEPCEGKGIGRVMNNIMYNIAWEIGFKCLSTISKNNNLVMHAHRNNSAMNVLKELDNDYLLVEFIKPVM